MHDDEPLQRHLEEVARRDATGPPDSFMYDLGLASDDRRAAGAGRPERTLDDVHPSAVRLEPAAHPLGEQVDAP